MTRPFGLSRATKPAATVQSPLAWTASPEWKLDYCNIERLTSEEIARRRAEFDKGKTQARSVREAAGPGRSDVEDEIA